MQRISDDFPFESRHAIVNGSNMHYIEEGSGDPILFIHGMPTWSYVWRNVIPFVSPHARCIAPDLIGMGRSDKPEIRYTVFEHIDYLKGFIDAIKLDRITLVMHGFGSIIGFEVARQFEDRIKGLAFLEGHFRPLEDPSMASLPLRELMQVRQQPDGGYDVVMNGSNYVVNRILRAGTMRRLTETELTRYREPFTAPGSCLPLWQYLNELPVGTDPDSPISNLIVGYEKWLEKSTFPKLMLYAIPGFNTPIDTVIWANTHFQNLAQVDIGDGLHYAQETNPFIIGESIANWYQDASLNGAG